jgi:transcriptional regulator with XRE-family HTH domain
MAKYARERPKRLARKLKQVREDLGLSQNQMLVKLKLSGKLTRAVISGFESGSTEPSLPVLLRYARLAGVSMDVLVDDKLDLPN